MSENTVQISQNSPSNQPKQKRKYVRRQAIPEQSQQIVPSENVIAMERELIPLIQQRQKANTGIVLARRAADQANSSLKEAEMEFQNVDAEIQFRMSIINQLKGIPPPPAQSYAPQTYGTAMNPARYGDYPQAVPPSPMYTPTVPYPTQPFAAPQPGVGSYPAQNRGLYPDATPRVDETGVEYNDGSAVREPMSVLEGRY